MKPSIELRFSTSILFKIAQAISMQVRKQKKILIVVGIGGAFVHNNTHARIFMHSSFVSTQLYLSLESKTVVENNDSKLFIHPIIDPPFKKFVHNFIHPLFIHHF
jgi:hypothetical protein